MSRVIAHHNTINMNLIQLKRIFQWVNQGSRRTFILKDINLDIEEGEFVSIMGPSGSGKSTLLHILGTLEQPSEGEYFLKARRFIN